MKKTKFRYINSEYLTKNKINYKSNRICNQKYNKYTLFIRVLLQQFEYFFNSFFFMIAVTQCFDRFAVGSPISSIGPWVSGFMHLFI
ncbi:phospholipid-transporting ATPase IIA [Nosema bombycis CQ1]|uniref:Phospholipid-transporting ATPase IIA n=1 Tax=Nosema bombycis (strain CQ1 / CVCC 102059) TaxID=578461 RepID=R0KTB5_NOSB1|nr:phospholipid-transporting ATPase IIA [Nosema bombycis CQ1]|eukprot:EOB14051.1 phospholipid-transporting ATPase IIA [Nosema bombycis CQ1]